MARKDHWIDRDVTEYAATHSTRLDDLAQELVDETAATMGSRSRMQIGPEQSGVLTFIAHVTGARRAVEVGTFTGLSALSVARALPDDGRLLCCDVNEEWTAIAQRYWKRAGVDHKIELRIGPALDTLRSLPPEPEFDLAFIDADKANYDNYYEELLPRLRRNGVVLIDNTLWSGNALDETATDPDSVAIRSLNDALAGDERVDVVMLPIADGLTLVRKR